MYRRFNDLVFFCLFSLRPPIFINSRWLVERVAVAQVEKSLTTATNIAGCEGRLPTPPTISPLQASLLGWGLQSHALDVALLIGCVRVQNAQPVRLAVTDVEQLADRMPPVLCRPTAPISRSSSSLFRLWNHRSSFVNSPSSRGGSSYANMSPSSSSTPSPSSCSGSS